MSMEQRPYHENDAFKINKYFTSKLHVYLGVKSS